MEDQADPQLVMLSQIHNQLVDLKKIIVEIELTKSDTSHTLQTQLRQIIGNDHHIDAQGRSGGVGAPRQQKVIAPTNTDIQPEQSGEKYR